MAKYLISANGLTSGLDENSAKDLESIREFIGGWAELVTINWLDGSTAQMWIDEEGKIKSKKINYLATGFYRQTSVAKRCLSTEDFIVGDVVILTNTDKLN